MVHILLIETYCTQDHEMYHHVSPVLSHCIMSCKFNVCINWSKIFFRCKHLISPFKDNYNPSIINLNLNSPKISIVQTVCWKYSIPWYSNRVSNDTAGDSAPRHNSILGSLIENTKNERNSGIPLLVDLAFATNVRFLDEHELHLNDIELYKVFWPKV